MSPQEFADRHGRDVSIVYKWIKQGRLIWKPHGKKGFNILGYQAAPAPLKRGESKNGRASGYKKRLGKVKQLSKEGALIHVFDDLKEAAQQVGVSSSLICQALNKPNRSAGGFKWIRKTEKSLVK